MNIGIYFELENLDNLDSSQYLMIELIVSIAQDESKNRSENIKCGMRHSMSCGDIILNDKNFLGYRKNSTGDLVIVENEAKIIRIIFSLFLQGYGYRKINDHLEKHNIKRLLKKILGAHQLLTEYSLMKNMQDMYFFKKLMRRIS